MQTKQRILHKAISLFNQKGFHALTISDIAQHCEMSRGNLAYHFKNKQKIVEEVAEGMLTDIAQIQEARKNYPAFSNLSLDVRTCGILQKKYPFVFRDMSVLEHKPIKKVMKDWSATTIQTNLQAFAFAIEIGNMKTELYKGLYYQLALNAWLVTYYWVAQKAVRKVAKTEEAEKMIWSSIIPHFTPKGLKAFQDFYGKEYLENLGEPLEVHINENKLF